MTSALRKPLVRAILSTLADDSATVMRDGDGMSLPRLVKRLGKSASVIMRELTLMSEATVGGQHGPGWVRMAQADDRWMVHLTDDGKAVAQTLPTAEGAP